MFFNRSVILWVLAAFTLLHSQTGYVSGYVWEDKNRNGIREAGEPGIADVLVSNQIQVVKSDQSGQYRLPARDEMIVFITKPSGYELPLNPVNLPRFYYIHQPGGSPAGLDYAGINPTGELPAEVNFALYKTKAKSSFDVIVSGDPQPRDSTEVGYLRDDIVTLMKQYPAQFYIALGDIAFDNLNTYPMYNEVVSTLGLPAYNVHGNHDMNYKAKDDQYAEETFKRIYGPVDYSFNYGKVHFVVMDNVEYNGWNHTEGRRGRYRGYFSEQQLTWLKNDLSLTPENYLIVFSTHIPIRTTESEGDYVNLVNREAFFEILKNRKYLLSLSAHMHTIEHLEFKDKDGWKGSARFGSVNAGAACGAWWSGPKDSRGIPESLCLDGTPNGFFVFSFDGNEYNYRFIPAHLPVSEQMRFIFPAGTVPSDSLRGKDILVNIYNASLGTKVWLQIDQEPAVVMTQKTMADPFIEHYLSDRSSFPDWINKAVIHSHIWSSPVPAGLKAGVHTLKIYTGDQERPEYTGFSVFNVE